MALNTVELIPSATSYSPFSLGRVKLCSRPDPNILQDNTHQLFIKTLTWSEWFYWSHNEQTNWKTWPKFILPAEHGVGLGSEDGWVDHKTCVVYNQSDSFGSPQTARTLLDIFAHVDHVRAEGFTMRFAIEQAGGACFLRPGTRGARWAAWVPFTVWGINMEVKTGVKQYKWSFPVPT